MDNFNELEAMIGSAYLNFEAKADVPVIRQSEQYLIASHNPDALRALGPGSGALLLSLATLWHSFPADATDYSVSAHALALAANKILDCGEWEPGRDFPFTRDEMSNALADNSVEAQDGDPQPLLDLVAAAFDFVQTKEAQRHRTPPDNH